MNVLRWARSRRTRRAILAVLALLWAVALPALAGLPETPHPKQLSVADGLPSNAINDITEDRQGYLWIATRDGLARYDGIGFRVWRNEEGLHDNRLWAVHVDRDNRLWIGTNDAGLAVLDPERRAFRWYDREHFPGIGSNTVWSITSTRDGAIWFGTSNGGLHRLARDGHITRFMPRPGDPHSLPDAGVTHMSVAADGTLWIATKGGAARWNGRDFDHVPASALNSAAVDALSIDDDGAIWFGTGAGVSERTPAGVWTTTPLAAYGDTSVFKVLSTDKTGTAWLDIVEGLGRIDEGRIVNVPLYSDAAEGVVKPSWSGGYRDRDGGLWFASASHGLWYLPPHWRMFSVLARRSDDPTSPANAQVKGIAPSKNGSMWLVGSGGSLDRLDPETGISDHVVADIGDGSVPVSVLEDSRGNVWIGYLSGIARFDPVDRSVRRWAWPDATETAMRDNVTQLVEASDGALWTATGTGGIQVRDLEGQLMETMLPGDGHGLPAGEQIEQLGLAPDGGMWLAGSQGLSVWNAGTRHFDPVPGTPATRIYGYAVEGADTIWLARSGSIERYHWNGAGLRLQSAVDHDDGVPLIAPSGLVVDARGIVWVTSLRGLIRIDPAKSLVRIYGMSDGLPSQEFEERPVQRPADGRVLVGSPDGLVLFDPNVVRPSQEKPDLVIESVSVRRGEQVLDLPRRQRFTIDHGDRDLRVVARLLSFDAARANRYRFRLDGYDEDWVETGAGGERVFSSLEPGRYRLHMKARTADDVWSDASTIAFTVAPPWWLSWWAITLWGTLAILAAWRISSAYRLRLKRRTAWHLSQHKRELAEQASLAKTRFLATLGHEVRTPMTGVLGMSELLLATGLDEKQRGYTVSIRHAGEHLMRLVNDALDLARIEADRLELDVQPFDLRALLRDVAALMAPGAREHGLAFREDVAADTPHWLRGDATRVRQILLNLLGNAIKFTERGEVSLLAAPSSAQGVCLTVADTGPGLNEEQKQRLFRRFEQAEGARTAARYGGSGLGLAISQELAAAMGGRIDVISEPGQGTRFVVELPLPTCAAPREMLAETRVALATHASLAMLLVEDDPTVAEVIVGLLRAQGHRVVHAAHGLAALAASAGTRFDLALLDLDLPGIDGFALARQLRMQGFDRPLLAVTARADADAEPLALEAGFDGFLRKPLTGGMLAEAIEALVPEEHRES